MKKASKSKNNSVFSSDNEMTKLLLLIVIVAIAFAIFYVITLFVVKKDEKTSEPEVTESTIQYEKILVSSILTQKSDEYYVLVYRSNDQYLDTYKNYLSYYEMAKTDSIPYYYVDLDSQFNKSFISEKSKLDVKEAKDFKFSQTALLRIKDGKVISTYEGKDDITGKLSRISK